MTLTMKPIFECTIFGRPIVKKNTQRIIGFGRKKRAIYSPRYISWEANAIAACKRAISIASIDRPIVAEFSFFFLNRQAEADTSNLVEGIQDVLKKAGVIADDRLIYRLVAEKYFGSEPRTEVRLFTLEDERGAA